MNKRLKIFLIFLNFFVSGCIVQSKQMTTLLNFIDRSQINVDEMTWRVAFRDYEAMVYPISVKNGVLFSNGYGDQILFDGWYVILVRGLGVYKLDNQIIIDANLHTFKTRNNFLGTSTCESWIEKELSGIKLFSLTCSTSNEYKNSILVSEDGTIASVRQVINSKGQSITLTNLSSRMAK